MACALVALGRKPDCQEINRYASDVELSLIDYFDYWLDREPAVAGLRTAVGKRCFLAVRARFWTLGLKGRGDIRAWPPEGGQARARVQSGGRRLIW
jgi:hypothetical protein